MSELKYKEAGVFIAVAGEGGVAPYERPADWLPLPAVNDGDQKFVGLHAVYDHESNFVAVNCAGDYTVDWGDGTVENFATGVNAYHSYVYANLGVETLSTRGYRQAIVTITPQAGQNLTTVSLYVKHTQVGLVSAYATGWLDIRMAGSLISNLTIASVGTNVIHRMLEQFEYVGVSAIGSFFYKFHNCGLLRSIIGTAWTASATDFTSMFANCSSLLTIPLLDTAAGTNFTSMFSGCSSLRTVPLLDTALGTIFGQMFGNCQSLQSIPLLNTTAGTSFLAMFAGCSSLRTIPLIDTAAGTDFTQMFNTCHSLQTIPLLNTALGTSFSSMFANCKSLQTIPLLDTAAGTNFSSMFSGCSSLQTVPLLDTALGTNFGNMFSSCPSLRVGALAGTSKSIWYTNCALSPAALNDIYTNLASGVTAQTITVTGNWGVASDDPSIATAKGWTVTG